jgi:hypothetical protein
MRALRVSLLGLVLLGLLLMPGCKSDNDNGGYRIAEYYPLGQGDTWTYRNSEGSRQDTVAGTETIDGVQAVKVQRDDGSYILVTNTNGITQYKEYQQENGGWEQMVYSPPLSISSSEMSVGDRHTFRSTMTYSDSGGFTDTATVSGETTLEGFEDVTVPAGTFSQCLKLKTTLTFTFPEGSFTIEVTVFLAKGVGEVKNIDQSTDDGVVVTETTELLSATVGGVSYP